MDRIPCHQMGPQAHDIFSYDFHIFPMTSNDTVNQMMFPRQRSIPMTLYPNQCFGSKHLTAGGRHAAPAPTKMEGCAAEPGLFLQMSIATANLGWDLSANLLQTAI